jgi:hypothetical protein
VADHSSPIAGQAHIKFESITAVCQREVKRFEGVFRNGPRGSRTTVAQ